MEQIVKKVLKQIENNGYEAYLVGGYVRDLILAKKTYDVDICTNALPRDLNRIFPNCQNNKYGGINFKLKKFNFDITTYRKEIKYEMRKPIESEYINNLLEDITRRDFKINAICMNSKGLFIDLIKGLDDIKSKKITTIGECNQKFSEDPLRMLRAIRFMTVLDFALAEEIENEIINLRQLILTLSNTRIKEELDKILTNKNVIKGLDKLKSLGVLDLLKITYDKVVYVNDLLGMWAQLDFEFNSSFTKEEKNNIINIRKILDLKNVDEKILFQYGLYQSLVAGEILGISKVHINRLYKQMPIHSKQEIVVSSEDIMNILNIEPGEILSVIMNEIVNEILSKKIKNNFQDIKDFLLRKKATWAQ